ncbi:hypothetical protein CSA17_01420 [bacterium DOLJORAL78_65_58]|nr:MAG: hypothetical protein CSA17_01420 [bacterium DOLJORAL78_65_58]
MQRHNAGPILTRAHIPAMEPDISDVSSVFNPGAVRIGAHTYLLLRVQTRGRRTFSLPAVSPDGVSFRMAGAPTLYQGLPLRDVHHIYDARLTVLDGRLHAVTAVDCADGCRCALWRATGPQDGDFAGLEKLEFVSLVTDMDTRNAVLFPERIGGLAHALHRPNQAALQDGPVSGTAVHLAVSEDLLTWHDRGPVFAGNPHYWDELVGSGPPPIKTRAGWLHIYHGIATHFQAANIYQAGVILLDTSISAPPTPLSAWPAAAWTG